jgi:hypothetical protein
VAAMLMYSLQKDALTEVYRNMNMYEVRFQTLLQSYFPEGKAAGT